MNKHRLAFNNKHRKRFAAHGNGICLLNGRSTETKATQHVLKHARCLYLLGSRLQFYRADGTSSGQRWFPSLLIGMSLRDLNALAKLRDHPEFGGVLLHVAKNP